jgi:hypothetical protein
VACGPTPPQRIGAEQFERLLAIHQDLAAFDARHHQPCVGKEGTPECREESMRYAVNTICNPAGEVRGKLWSELRVGELPGSHQLLEQANESILAACGQLWLMYFPSRPSVVVDQAHARWLAGYQQEVKRSCELLIQIAPGFGRPQPTCRTSSP